MTLTSNTPITQENAALYERAVMFATRDKPSPSYLQRRLQIGYNQATGLIERMQAEGLISGPNSAGTRKILVPYAFRPALAKPAEGEVEPFAPSFYDKLLAHAWTALRERKPFEINADGAIAIITQAKADRAALAAAQTGGK